MDLGVDDSLWCSVMLRNSKKLLIGIVYYSSSSIDVNDGRLISSIKSINESNSYIQGLLVRDFCLILRASLSKI